jgi:surface protein
MPTVQLYDNNHSGLTADITFSAITGGSFSLGLQTIPYTFSSDYPYGTYSLYYSQWGQTCSVNIPEPPFISTWRTTTSNETIGLPLIPGGNYNFTVNWGDGNIETITSYLNNQHEYAVTGDYTVTITGTIEGWSFYDEIYDEYYGTPTKLINVLQWGCLNIGNRGGVFFDTINLTLDSVVDVLNLQGVYNLDEMFGNSGISLVNRINEWDVSGINSMAFMFENSQFNQPLNNWNVSGVTKMNYMFNSTPFNQPIGNWDVSNVQFMNGMFINATSFNSNISGWNVSGVTNMDVMFYGATLFNQDLSLWCVTNIPSEPTSFADGASSWVLPKPNWGTCPP